MSTAPTPEDFLKTNGLTYPVISTTASVRITMDVSEMTDEQVDNMPDLGVEFQHLDKEERLLILVIDLDGEDIPALSAL